jgi:mannan endo-1,4-beta-mannosidase
MLVKIAYIAQDIGHQFEPVGRWLFVKLVVLGFGIAGLARLVPKKPRRGVPGRSHSVAIGRWSAAALVGAAAVTGSAYLVLKAEQQLNAQRASEKRILLAQENKPAQATLLAKPMSYLGVLEPGAPYSYSRVSRFAALTASHPRIVSYYSGWGEAFQTTFANVAYANGAVAFVQMMPYHISLTALADGHYDAYLREYSTAVRRYRHAVAIGFGPEMNGNWYSWGYQHTSPSVWIAAWRHIVNLFRANGAGNVTWVWSVNIPGGPTTGPMKWWWPGKQYVTWVGIDGYFVPGHKTFSDVIQPTFSSIRSFTNAPVLISETGIAPGADQVATLRRIFRGVRIDKMLGFIYFDENQPTNKDYHYNWRLEDNLAAVAEYSRLAMGW